MNERLDLDKLVAELEQAVGQRRSAGEYSEDLDSELDSVFARARQLERHDFEPLKRSLAELDAASRFGRERIHLESRLPGGAVVHRAAAAAVRRSVEGVLTQTQEFADIARETMRHVVDALDDPRTHEHVDLRGDVDTLLQRLTELEMEVRRLRNTSAASGVVDPERIDIDWAQFAARFRGSDAHLVDHYQDLFERLDGQGPVLDVGCGSGFLVHELTSRGTQARGVDTDLDLVRAASRRGLDVSQQTAAGALAGAVPDSLGAVVMLHIVEHLAPDELPSIVRAAHRALVDGGLLVIETPNAASLYTHSHSFWLDPTHERLVPSVYLELVLTQAGFGGIEIVPRSPVPDDQRLVELPDDTPGAAVHNENIRRLNDTVFAPQDVMVVGVA